MEPFHFFQEVAQSLATILIKQVAKFNLGDKTLLKKFLRKKKIQNVEKWIYGTFFNF